DVTTALRHHPFEAALTAIVIGGGGVLLGVRPGDIAIYRALAPSVQLVAHANIFLPARVDAWVAPGLVTPGFHRLHHSRSRAEADSNYGQVFTFWDRIFGTCRRGDTDAVMFGAGEATTSAQRLLRVLVQPLLRG